MRTIVSLTSYGNRLNKTLPQALKSINNMIDFNADIIMLYLTKEDYNLLDKSNMPNNVTIKIVNDIKSFKKYYALTDKEFDNDIVFIADDDINFSKEAWVNLKTLYNKNNKSQCVYANRCFVFNKETKKYYVATNTKPNDIFLFGSGCGLLIPPKTMRFDKTLIESMFSYIQKNGFNHLSDDDRFMSLYCKINNIGCVCSYQTKQGLDFNGNVKLMDLRKSVNRNLLWLQTQNFFNCSLIENIVVSLTTTNYKKTYDTIANMFKQTIIPNKIILTLDKNAKYKPTKKFLKLQNDYNFEIQYTDYNATLKKFAPDNTNDNDLLFILDGDKTYPNNFLEKLYCEYYKLNNDNAISINKKLIYFDKYGHHLTINPNCTVVRQKYVKNINLNAINIELEVTKNILLNHKSIRLTKNN